jgi:alcohol dehydrogenase, propanol-preferring
MPTTRAMVLDRPSTPLVLRERAVPLPAAGQIATAPLLRAGLVGWRSYRLAGQGEALGLYGFGAAAHILAQVAAWQGRLVFAFTRAGDTASQDFARSLGACGRAVPTKCRRRNSMPPSSSPRSARSCRRRSPRVRKGGRVVCGGIHMSDILSFPYRLLWEERELLSVANLTRRDAYEFLATTPRAGIKMQVTRYPLEQANEALDDLRHGRFEGAAVLVP